MDENTTLPLLTYHPPYVYKPSFFNLKTPPRIPTNLDIVDDLIDINNSLTSFLLDWMRRRGLITYELADGSKDTFVIVPTRENTKGGAILDIVDRNMRSLVYEDELHAFIGRMRDNDVRSIMTDIQTLVTTITTTYPDTLVLIIINKVYRSLSSMPVEDADYTWDEIHKAYPFLWVVLYMQSLFYRFGDTYGRT